MKVHNATACVVALFLGVSLFSHTVAVRLVLLGAGIVLAAMCIARGKGEFRALPAIWLPFVLWGAWAALSVAWSLEPARTVKEWRNEVFYAGAALWICFVAAQTASAARVFLPVLGTAAAGACAIALWHFAHDWHAYQIGLHGGSGDHSSALLVLMPCALMTGWWAIRYKRLLWIGMTSLALAGLFLASAYTTLNRTIWLGFAVQFTLLGGLLLRRSASTGSGWTLRARTVLPALTVVAVAACSAVIVSIQTERQAVGVGGPLERDSRLSVWPHVVEQISERPLTGYGFGRGVVRHSMAELRARDGNLWHAHNLFLDTVVQIGVPGLALFALLLGMTLREAWRWTRDGDDGAAACGLTLIAVVAGMVVRNMTDTLLVRQNALLFWGVVGVLLAAGGRWRASALAERRDLSVIIRYFEEGLVDRWRRQIYFWGGGVVVIFFAISVWAASDYLRFYVLTDEQTVSSLHGTKLLAEQRSALLAARRDSGPIDLQMMRTAGVRVPESFVRGRDFASPWGRSRITKDGDQLVWDFYEITTRGCVRLLRAAAIPGVIRAAASGEAADEEPFPLTHEVAVRECRRTPLMARLILK